MNYNKLVRYSFEHKIVTVHSLLLMLFYSNACTITCTQSTLVYTEYT